MLRSCQRAEVSYNAVRYIIGSGVYAVAVLVGGERGIRPGPRSSGSLACKKPR